MQNVLTIPQIGDYKVTEYNMSQIKRCFEYHCLVIHIQTLPKPSPSDLVILEACLLSSFKLSLVLHAFLFV